METRSIRSVADTLRIGVPSLAMPNDRLPLELSPREQQLVKFASQGLTDTAIANRLGISEATVGTYWGRVRIKIGPFNRTELVSIYLRNQQELALDVLREENANLLAQLKAVADQGESGASLFESLIEHAPDAIILVSHDGVILRANRSAYELFGYSDEELENLPLILLIPERLRELHQQHRAEYISDPRKRSMGEHLATPALHKDGTEILVRATLSAMSSPSGLLVTCVLRPTGPRKANFAEFDNL